MTESRNRRPDRPAPSQSQEVKATTKTTVDAANDASAGQEAVVNRQEVERRAFELYEQRGGGHGRDLEDWLTAEEDVRNGGAERVR
jgi:hypothetical protein